MEHADTNIGGKKSTPGTSLLPPAVEPYFPKAKYDINDIVTPKTIIPACYFNIKSIEYDDHEQSYLYTIKSLPQIGDHYQPDLTRTVLEEVLESMKNIRKRQVSVPYHLASGGRYSATSA